MENQIQKLFKKHLDRMQDDLFQVNGFSQAMNKLIKANLTNLQEDVSKLHGVKNDTENNNNR